MICTLFIEGKAQVFSLRPLMNEDILSFCVTCLSAASGITPFAIGLRSGKWMITDSVPENIKTTEPQLVTLLNAYLEGQGIGQE
jgi:hypothetical protein